MATINTELSMVQRFHALLENYDLRPLVARRNSLPTLSRFLSSQVRQIRKLSLEAVHLLAEHHENIELLGNNHEIVKGVVEIYNETRYDDPELFDLSNKTLDLLAPAFHNGDPREQLAAHCGEQDAEVVPAGAIPLNAPAPSHAGNSSKLQKSSEATREHDTVVDDSHAEVAGDSNPTSTISGEAGLDMTGCSSYWPQGIVDPAPQPSGLVHSVNKDCPLSIVLEIPALDAMTDTSHIDEILQTTRGVISYTMTPGAHQIRVFLSAFAQAPLQNTLAEAGYENILISAERMHYQSSELGNQSLNGSFFFDNSSTRPSYVHSAKNFASKLFKSVMVYSDPKTNSLAERIRQKQAVEEGGSSTTADRLARAFSRWW
ncbi:hypothetical protein JKF63_00835 [Porcisia hertigi]|uniref:Uncharacterized protein n=1 Tax=Porcisia hertigi TaxID=2761500 RepID=A0A836HZS7_9TRYP|nr:hypothetical protein JKF63_00835 [Porcisia hertigi]